MDWKKIFGKEKEINNIKKFSERHKKRVLEMLAQESMIESGKIVPFPEYKDPALRRGYRAPLKAVSIYVPKDFDAESLADFFDENIGENPNLGKQATNSILYFLPAPWEREGERYKGRREYCLIISARTNELNHKTAQSTADVLVFNAFLNLKQTKLGKEFSDKGARDEHHNNVQLFDVVTLLDKTIRKEFEKEGLKLPRRG